MGSDDADAALPPFNSSIAPPADCAPEARRFPRYDHYNLYIHPATDAPEDAAKIVP